MSMVQNSEAYFSAYGSDPDLAELVAMFVDEMPDRVKKLQDAHTTGNSESLRQTVHQLKGAAGSYGFDQLTPLAAALEDSIRDQATEEVIKRSLLALVAACNRVRAGAAD